VPDGTFAPAVRVAKRVDAENIVDSLDQLHE
jgi:hypothetical protein